ncbi:MAG: hypothetical protein M9928_19225 [Anaerolineae bacterium]|nr:hypothetical protein [Anaerolineae bacterium]MCO5207147.1 hypothetical protein [Anaerolineae bacterium]
MTEAKKPSQWQQSIAGEWHGRPSVFDAAGNHVGYNKVYRSSVFEGDRVTYYMDTRLDAVGPLRARFEAQKFAFGVADNGTDRIYMGPDFMGAGHPYGLLVDAHYYSPAWTSDLRTMVHVIDNGTTQVYSSLLYDGPTINGVFNGIYKVAFDYQENPETRAIIDAFVETEVANGKKPHVLPMKYAGTWHGEMDVYNAAQEKVGVNQVEIHYVPKTLLSAETTISISGVINREFTFLRRRSGIYHTYEGPDIFGNSIGYGRALYTSQHIYGEALKIRGREFLIDDTYRMSVVWDFLASDKRQYMTFGVLEWQVEKEVLAATY